MLKIKQLKGKKEYKEIDRKMNHQVSIVSKNINFEEIWFLEHENVYTAGSSTPKDLKETRINNIPSLNRKSAVDTAIERCGLGNVRKRLIHYLSRGYQQRVGIAQAIIHTPAVVILDEPTSGLDPIQIREIRQLIKDIAQEHSVILSTHILPEVQMLCDRVKIINQGSLVFNDTTDALQQQMQSSHILLTLGSPPDIATLEQLPGVTSIDAISNTHFKIHYQPDHNPTQIILESTVSHGWQLTALTPGQHSLEDVFMDIIQQETDQTKE